MIKKLLLSKKIKKTGYLRTLISIEKSTRYQNEKAWLYYKLGMFQSVVEENIRNYSARGCVAKVITFVMLGRIEEALKLLSSECSFCLKRDYFLLEIAPYFPDFVLTKSDNLPLVVKTALLLKQNKNKEACHLSKSLFQRKSYRNNPELLLYHSNACNISTKKQSTLFNIFLAQYNLQKIYLVNKDKPFFIDNLKSNIRKIKRPYLVSIVMTAYNSEKYITYALHSLLAQTYENIEIIVVDDCSTDNTTNIVKNIAKYDQRVTLIRLKENVGTYVAKNIALTYINGEYVICHDSDDYAHPAKIENQIMPLIKNPKLVASISYWIRIDEDGQYYARYYPSMMKLNMSSLMFRRGIIEKIGYYDNVRTGADSEYFHRIALAYGEKSLIKIKKPLSLGAHRSDSLMNDKERGHKQDSISHERLSYYEAWMKWHMKLLKENKIPYISFPNKKRAFNAPKGIIVLNFNLTSITLEKKQDS